MNTIFCERYGSILDEDAAALELALSDVSNRWKEIKFLEIGMFAGGTGAGARHFLEAKGCTIDYWGIDAGFIMEPKVPFPGAHIVKGDSAIVFGSVPEEFHIVFIDGCHCLNHVILDTYHYGTRVVPGGYMIYHDASPEIQGTDKQPCGHNAPEFHIAVLEAINRLELGRRGWEPKGHTWRSNCPLGGMATFYKP